MNVNMTRRDILMGTGVAAALAIAGTGTWVAIADPKSALLSYLKHTLPGVKIEEVSAGECVDEFLSRWSWKEKRAAGVAWQSFGVEAIGSISEKFELAARRFLTTYLMNSNFFAVTDPRATAIVYTSRPPGTACANPFANLNPPV